MRAAEKSYCDSVEALIPYDIYRLICDARTYNGGGCQYAQRTAETRKSACDSHGDYDIALAAHACILRSVLIESRCPKLIAEGGVEQNNEKNHGEHNSNDDPDIQICARPQSGQLRLGGDVISPRLCCKIHGGAVAYKIINYIHADIIEHDGGDYLVNIEQGLEKARD